MDLIVGTRFWGKNEADWNRLRHFLKRAEKFCRGIVVVVNCAYDHVNTKARLQEVPDAWAVPIHVQNIPDWSGVTAPLNLLTELAIVKFQASTLLVHSTEVCAGLHTIHLLYKTLRNTNGCLVVGHSLPGHQHNEYTPSIPHGVDVELTGQTCPWNTLAVWDVARLQRTGFVDIADRVDPPGMEEVATIALQRKLHGEADSKAVVVHVHEEGGQPQWACDFTGDVDRRAKHQKKMDSKSKRAAEILEYLAVRSADTKVHHMWCAADTTK